MDRVNRFHTSETWFLVRAEHLTLVLVLSVLVIRHTAEIAWGRFLIAFILIDLIGYVPGAIAFRRAKGGAIAPIFHHLYNVAHSYLTAAVAAALWALAAGHLEWAMLAMPLHLSGDRGLFGNTYKPVSLPFEPAALRRLRP